MLTSNYCEFICWEITFPSYPRHQLLPPLSLSSAVTPYLRQVGWNTGINLHVVGPLKTWTAGTSFHCSVGLQQLVKNLNLTSHLHSDAKWRRSVREYFYFNKSLHLGAQIQGYKAIVHIGPSMKDIPFKSPAWSIGWVLVTNSDISHQIIWKSTHRSVFVPKYRVKWSL